MEGSLLQASLGNECMYAFAQRTMYAGGVGRGESNGKRDLAGQLRKKWKERARARRTYT